ncbi:hypothetical protein BGZ60DRAFT_417628 [Tricladium varicosporioides]|nr:hypothetical protein BGZ60DRAFT_417628 [Hymenoscyphus varicosporioides]
MAASRPTIVCLCGSTRFMDAFREANERETLAGKIVLSVGVDMRTSTALSPFSEEALEGIKVRLDALHKEKIKLADEILVLNVGAYIGESTRSEIAFARGLGKKVRYLEEVEDEAF